MDEKTEYPSTKFCCGNIPAGNEKALILYRVFGVFGFLYHVIVYNELPLELRKIESNNESE